jgi:hypothetical protein
MRTEETEIEVEGKPTKVKIRGIRQEEIETLFDKHKIKGTREENEKNPVGALKYQREALSLTILEPENLKSMESLGKLEALDFQELVRTYTKVNSKLSEKEKDFLSEELQTNM